MRSLVLLRSLGPACAMLLPSCAAPASCSLGTFQEVVAHVGSTIKLNTQSDCAGYSRAQTINGVANDQAIDATPICEPDPTDDPCTACLRPQCCDAVTSLCSADGGAALDPEACASLPAVHDCLARAAAGACAPACGRDS